MEITLSELEEVINYWRMLRPSIGEERCLSPEVNALATNYALMIFYGLKSMSLDQMDPFCIELIRAWHTQRLSRE